MRSSTPTTAAYRPGGLDEYQQRKQQRRDSSDDEDEDEDEDEEGDIPKLSSSKAKRRTLVDEESD